MNQDIPHWTTILFVSTTGEIVVLGIVDLDKTTVQMLLRRVEEELVLSHQSEHRLYYGGEPLDGQYSLAYHGIKKGSQIELRQQMTIYIKTGEGMCILLNLF